MNMCYPKGFGNFYKFLEIGLFNMDPKGMPTTVGTFLTRLKAMKLE